MKKKICCLIIVFSLIFTYVMTLIPLSAAEGETNTVYSDVLDDLSIDSTFNPSDYPTVTDKEAEGYASVEVIQIAEGTNKELFIYTYEPSKSVISLELFEVSLYDQFVTHQEEYNDEKTFTPRLYSLECVSTSGVFSKYLVKDYVVSDLPYRYYNIIEVYRHFHEDIDTGIEGVIINGKAIKVSQQWCAYWLNNVLYYQKKDFETVEITPVFNGDFKLTGGYTIGNLAGHYNSAQVWFLCFNVDNYDVDLIYDADIVFDHRDYTRVDGLIGGAQITYSNEVDDEHLYLSKEYADTYQGEGLFGREYHWNNISTSFEFCENWKDQVTFSSGLEDTIKKSQFVFIYAEYELRNDYYSGYTYTYGTEVTDVSILRLHFCADGKTYNLGAVMDKTSADNISDGAGSPDFESLKDIFRIILLIFLVIALCLFGSWLFPAVSSVFKAVVNGIAFVITLPLRLFRGSGRRKY